MLDRLGEENLDGIEAAVQRYGIDCDFRRTGALDVATEPWQVDELRARAALHAGRPRAEAVGRRRRYERNWTRRPTSAGCGSGTPPRWWSRRGWPGGCAVLRSRTASGCTSTRRCGRWTPGGTGSCLRTPNATVRARRVVLATNAFPSLLRRLRTFVIPVYDYVLVTEPLSTAQLDVIGWRNRQGVGDSGNQFHYYRLTRDDRILFGRLRRDLPLREPDRQQVRAAPGDLRPAGRHFAETFPQLADVRFTHRWGGVIDTSTRFCAFYGTAARGRVAYALGFTGLGVGASRFAADVVLDLLTGADTERTRLEMVRRRPVPFPPEPVRALGIALTKRAMARADSDEGRRNLWLRTLDRAGLGFDS